MTTQLDLELGEKYPIKLFHRRSDETMTIIGMLYREEKIGRRSYYLFESGVGTVYVNIEESIIENGIIEMNPFTSAPAVFLDRKTFG